MRRFRRFFALLFILSLFAGVVHELSHAHHHGEVCEVCLLAHTPALVSDAPALVSLEQSYEPFDSPQVSRPIASAIIDRSRSPPLS